MKQSTQKFLARLLALLLVLGLAPEAWSAGGGLISEAQAATTGVAANDPYIFADGTRVNNNGSTTQYWTNSYYRTKSFSIGYPSAHTGTISWYVNGTLIGSTNTTVNSYLSASVTNDVLTVTVNSTYASSYYTVAVRVAGVTYSTCTVYTDANNSYGSLAYVNVGYSYSYSLGDRDDSGNSSIVSQLLSYSGVNTGAYVTFTGTTTSTYGSLSSSSYSGNRYYLSTGYASGYSYLGNVVFTPSGTAGTAVFPIRLYYNNSTSGYVDGTIAFNTTGTTNGGDIPYSGVTGESVYFSSADFENFYYDKTNGGTLTSVRFSTPSTGTGSLYSNTGSRLSSSTDCYASATGSRTALDGVYFTPSGTTATNGNTVRISFTAYGNRNYSGTYNRSVSGTVVITYNNGSARDITYTPAGGSINLSSSDFTSVYRDTVGSTAPSSLTIQFQNVPSNGSLTYRSGTSSSVRLTSSNIKSYRFTTSQLSDITYSASGTYTDSIEYIAYTSGTSRYTGRVVFNPSSTTMVPVTLVSSSSGVAFNLAAFTQANPTVMANCTQIQFTIPRSGSLTYANSLVSTNGVTVPVNMLGQVFYRPNTNYSSTDYVSFICYNAAGSQIGSGQVSIVVSGGTTNNTGVYDISQFTDVSATAWYRAELADLVSKGIMQGKGNGKFDPLGQVKNGEALKMILLAAGYPQQTEPSGNDWAINYKTLAVNNNLISSSVVLNNNMTRNAVAELAGKALGLTPVTSGSSPFTDSTNGYAIALYNAGILTGDTTSGSRKFLGNNTLQRAEICAIIYRINSYKAQQSNVRPGWLS